MYSRRRYQYGSLCKRRRRKQELWQYRYYETREDGGRIRRAITVGTTLEFPQRADALRAVEALQLKLNAESPRTRSITMNGLIDRYTEDELPERYSTRLSYLAVIKKWIRPRWGAVRLREVKVVAVEQWLRSLDLAPKTKTHIRNLMHLLFQNARRWEWIDRNPIELVRQSGMRKSIPRVLEPAEIQRLLAQLGEPFRTMVLLAVCTGLRVSEIIGLQWGDISWSEGTVMVERSVVHGRTGETKTEYSRKPVPLDPELVLQLRQWREQAFYRDGADWVFASDSGKPRWQETILKRQVKPAGERAGIGKVGWHTFRHTYSTMLRAVGTDVKVQQELLRHADIHTTMNVYTQATAPAKWEAQGKVVEMVLRGREQKRLMGANGSQERIADSRN
jgi:integrase